MESSNDKGQRTKDKAMSDEFRVRWQAGWISMLLLVLLAASCAPVNPAIKSCRVTVMLAGSPGRGHAGPDWVDATLVTPPGAGFEVS